MDDPLKQGERRALRAVVRGWRAEYRDLYESTHRTKLNSREKRAFAFEAFSGPATQRDSPDETFKALREGLIRKTVDLCVTTNPFIKEKVPYGIAFAAMTLLHDIQRGAVMPPRASNSDEKADASRHIDSPSQQRSFFVTFWCEVILEVITRKKDSNWREFVKYILKEHIFGLKRCIGGTVMSFESLLETIQDGTVSVDSIQSVDFSSLVVVDTPSEQQKAEFSQRHTDRHSYGHLVVLTGANEFRVIFALLRALKRQAFGVDVVKLLFVFFEAELVARYTNTLILSGDTHHDMIVRSRLELIRKTLLRSMYTFGPTVSQATSHTTVLAKIRSLDFLDNSFWKRNLHGHSKHGFRYCRSLSESDLLGCVMAIVEHRVSRDDIWPIAVALLSHHTKAEYLRQFLERTLLPVLRSFYTTSDENAVRSSLRESVSQKCVKTLASALVLNLCHPSRGIRDASYRCLRDLSFAYTHCFDGVGATPSGDSPLVFDYISARVLSSRFGKQLLERALFDPSVDKRFVYPSSALLHSLDEDTWRRLTWKSIAEKDLCAMNLLARQAETALDEGFASKLAAPPADVCSLLFSPDPRLCEFYAQSMLLFLVSYTSKVVWSGVDRFSARKRGLSALRTALEQYGDAARVLDEYFTQDAFAQRPFRTDAFIECIGEAFVYNCITRSECRDFFANAMQADFPDVSIVDDPPECFYSRVREHLIGMLVQSSQKIARITPCADFLALILQVSQGEVEETRTLSPIRSVSLYASACTKIWTADSLEGYRPQEGSIDTLGKSLLEKVTSALRALPSHVGGFQQMQEAWGVAFVASAEVAEKTLDAPEDTLLTLWIQMTQLVMSRSLCENRLIIAALQSSILFLPTHQKLLGITFSQCIRNHGVGSLHFWVNALLGDVRIATVPLLGCAQSVAAKKNEPWDSIKFVEEKIRERSKSRSDRIDANAFKEVFQGDSPQEISSDRFIQWIREDFEQFGIGFSSLHAVFNLIESSAEFRDERFSQNLLNGLHDLNSLWTQVCLFAFCCRKSFSNALRSVFEAELVRSRETKPFDSVRYAELSNIISKFLGTSLILIEQLAQCSPEERATCHRLVGKGKAREIHALPLPVLIDMETFAEERKVLTSLEEDIQSIDGSKHFAIDGIKHIFLLSLSHHQENDKISPSYELKSHFAQSSLSNLCKVFVSSTTSPSSTHRLAAAIAFDIMQTSDDLPREIVQRPSTQSVLSTVTDVNTASVDDNMYADAPSIHSDGTSQEIPPEAVHSAILEQSSDSPMSSTTSSRSTRPSTDSEVASAPAEQDPEASKPSISPAPSGKVSLSALQTLRSAHWKRSAALPSLFAHGTPSIFNPVMLQDPTSALQDLASQVMGDAACGVPLPGTRGAVDLDLLKQVVQNQSVESALRNFQSPLNSESDKSASLPIDVDKDDYCRLPPDMTSVKTAFMLMAKVNKGKPAQRES